MFDLFKKKDTVLYAPVKGKCVDLKRVKDPMFSEKLLGDGVAFEIKDNTIYAPCDGRIIMIADTKHALGIQTKKGEEILIHVGLETVNYFGKGLKVFVEQNEKIKKGQKLIEVDTDFFKQENVDLTTPMVVVSKNVHIEIISDLEDVDNDTVIMKLGD